MEPARYRKAMVVLFDVPTASPEAAGLASLNRYQVLVTDPRRAGVLAQLLDEAAETETVNEDTTGWAFPLWLDIPDDIVPTWFIERGYALSRQLPRIPSLQIYATLLAWFAQEAPA